MNKVVIGLSGGVDSSVAAYLLKKEGYDVIGVTMEVYGNEADGASEAKKVADSLGIPHYVLDFKDIFKDNVIDYFISDYFKGRTPNPCIICNRFVKWEALLQKSKEFGADFIATGHYANVVKHPVTDRYTLEMAGSKDQTYALYNLTQEQLKYTLMPVGKYSKDKIRAIAAEIGLDVANKPDSQDICFIPDGDYSKFIRENSENIEEAGNFVDINGNILGQHKGISNYTIGQRKGLGIALGVPAYVTEIKKDTNEVVIGSNEDLFKTRVLIESYNPVAYEDIEDGMRVQGKLRYAQKKADCTLYKKGDIVEAVFDEPQRAVTPGQAAVFYDGNYVVGGGIIKTN